MLSRIFSGNCFRLLNAMHHTVHMRHWGRSGTLLDTLLDTHDTLMRSRLCRNMPSMPRFGHTRL